MRAIKREFAARRLAGAVVAAMATLSGAAIAAQPGYVTSATGALVMTSSGDCWRGGSWTPGQALGNCDPAAVRTGAAAAAGSAAPAAERTQLAQAGRERARIAPSAGGSTPASAPEAGAGVMEPGYVNSPGGINYRTAYGECWRAGYWTPGMASEPCDAVARASAAPPPPPPVAKAPEPAPAPVPEVKPEPAPLAAAPAPQPRGPLIQKITLETDVLFEFDKAELRASGRKKLDEVADGLKEAKVDEVLAIGHADRIASERYNQKLSEERAAAVKSYLAQRGVPNEKIVTEGRGEQQPVTGQDCRKMGPERGSNRKLVSCLQPDRRVEIEVFGTREVASGEQPATGATGSGSGAASSPSSGSGSGR